MDNEQLYKLIDKYRHGTASAEEVRFLEAYYRAFDLRPDITEASDEQLADQFWQEIKAGINNNITTHKTIRKVIPLWQRITVAASVLMFLFISSYFFLNHLKTAQLTTQHQGYNIVPGKNQAVLILANGQKILLTSAPNGQLAKQGPVNITKTQDGQIAYTAAGRNATNDVKYNTAETPKGGQYQITLSDGTKVWLNAASSLKYPIQFSGKERVVELSGEAYFEVAKNKSFPFKIKSVKQTVEVLGTHFNINTYNDEPSIRTTLLEGSVKVFANAQSYLLIPGQQLILSGQNLRITNADIEETIAWKNGYFRFHGEKIGSIMRKISRWYDVDVQYNTSLTNEGFNGKISRFKNINQVLNMLEETKAVHFRIEGRRITVIE